MTAILGLSAFYHDSAAALVVDGDIVAAAQEERFTRKKHDHDFPVRAVQYCLEEAGLRTEQLDYVAFYDKPLLKFDRLLETYLSFAPAGFGSFLKAMPVWLQQKLHIPREIRAALGGWNKSRIVFTEHHESHAASAFFPSPFEEAAILTLDGVGEWATASIGVGKGNRIEQLHEQHFPHSLGLLYSAFTYYCGFKVNSDEYKLMGLAPYGDPTFVDVILENLIDLKEDGSFRMDMSYFDYCHGLTMTSPKFYELFKAPPRKKDGPIDQRVMDIAASIQKVTEEVMLRSARHAQRVTGMKNLCLAGGVALNCVGNGRILRDGPFDDIWIQPAADDAGGALGAALLVWHQLLDNPRAVAGGDRQQASLLGPEFADDEIRAFLDGTGATYQHIPDADAMCSEIADAIAAGEVVGWFQGRMEFGPRALGSRSLLGDPRSPKMQTIMNVKVKFRESFRPFAPAVLVEHAHEYFDVPEKLDSPYMLLVAPVREARRVPVDGAEPPRTLMDKLRQCRSELPAITHVDYSARIQSVDERHGLYRKVIEKFYEKTGCPVIVNTSFNLGWDPIVCSPKDAYDTFMACDIDVLCMGGFVLRKDRQPAYVASTVNGHDTFLEQVVASPCHRAPLKFGPRVASCSKCGHEFQREGGILEAFWPHAKYEDPADTTRTVKAFYEAHQFPPYEDDASIRSLIERSRADVYSRALDRSIPYNTDVLEVGCGTGHLTNYLGISCRRVVGADICLESLQLGERFRRDQGLSRVRFVQMNLFAPCFQDEQFDVVICNGVLHHTADPRAGLERLLALVKPGGHFVVGLHNTWGRLFSDARGLLFRLTGGRGQWVDPVLRSLQSGERAAWFAQQYRHPHATKHSIGEVLGWFDERGLEFVRGVPSVTPGPDELGKSSLFERRARGTALEHFVVQAEQVLTGGRQGGFFLMIGRKAPSERPETVARPQPPMPKPASPVGERRGDEVRV